MWQPSVERRLTVVLVVVPDLVLKNRKNKDKGEHEDREDKFSAAFHQEVESIIQKAAR